MTCAANCGNNHHACHCGGSSGHACGKKGGCGGGHEGCSCGSSPSGEQPAQAVVHFHPAPRKKRIWCYVQPPAAYEIPPCASCGAEAQWSEYEGHLWCDHCQKDFIPAHGGVFEGPIPAQAAALLGVSFDRIILDTQQIERFDPESGAYQPAADPQNTQG